MAQSESDFKSLLTRQEKFLIFKKYYEENKIESDEFFEQNEPENDSERKNFILYWDMLLSQERIKRQRYEIDKEKNELEKIKLEKKRKEIADEIDEIKMQELAKRQKKELEDQENELEKIKLEKKRKEIADEIDEIKIQELAKRQKKELEDQKEVEYNNQMLKLFNLLDGRFKYESGSDLTKLKALLDLITSAEAHGILDGELIKPEIRERIVQDIQIIFIKRVDFDFVLDKLKLKGRQFKVKNQVLNSRGKPYPPSSFTGNLNLNAAQYDQNIIFGYPYDIQIGLPIVFFHQMFGDFLDIINDNLDNAILNKYFSFLDTEISIEKLDECCLELVKTILNSEGSERDISKGVTMALKELFGREFIQEQFFLKNFVMDAMISLSDFPFAIIEFKDKKYSIDAVYQSLQYYASFTERYLDNFPTFIITIDRGFMFVYGAATVNTKIFCDHLITIELTACRSETNNSAKMFRRVIGALLFSHQKLKYRLKDVSEDVSKFVDEIDVKFSDLNSAMIANSVQEFVFFPSIFGIKSYEDSTRIIPIKFIKNIIKNVFIVTVDSDSESDLDKEKEKDKFILKLTNDYGIDAHLHLANLNLAPKIIGYEKIYGNYHMILMKYMDEIEWKMLFEYKSEIQNNIFNNEIIFDTLKTILDNFHESGYVHGDFRNCNVLMKISGDEKNEKYEFMIIDFDCSGRIGSRYSNLIFKNPTICWPRNDFGSDAKRKIEHDTFMFEMMKREMTSLFRF